MKRDEKTNILAAIDIAISKCTKLAEEAETYEEQQYQWGQADGLYNASILIAGRPEA